MLPAWHQTMYFNDVERQALQIAEEMTDIRRVSVTPTAVNASPFSGAAQLESRDCRLPVAQEAALRWLATTTNTLNRLAIGSRYVVRP